MYVARYRVYSVIDQPTQVSKLKHQYLAKTRRADEAEDEYVAIKTFSLRKLMSKRTVPNLLRTTR